MKNYIIASYFVVSVATIISCNDNTKEDKQNKEKSPSTGEIVFTDSSDYSISYDNMILSFTMQVYERENSDDLITMGLSAETNNVNLGIVVNDKITPPDNGIQINKKYILGEESEDSGRINYINLILNKSEEEDYFSVDGNVTINFDNGIAEGTFDTNVRKVNEVWSADSGFETWHFSGKYKTNDLDFRCHILDKNEADTNIDYGDDTGSETIIKTHQTTLDNPFCKQYL